MISSLLASHLRHASAACMRFDHSLEQVEPPQPQTERTYLLYVHIPFCESICPFCPFHRVLMREDRAQHYFVALREEIRRYRERGFDFSSVYVGGGTPTIMPEELCETLTLIRSLFSVEQICVETNPNHLIPETIRSLKEVGVNRLSVGVQSFDDALLREMQRYTPYGSGEQIVGWLKDAQGEFDTLNVDMIFNFPHQTTASLERDIQILRDEIRVDQVTFYPLMAAASTHKAMSKTIGKVTFAREQEFYELILAGMQDDYRPTTGWCFSRGASMLDEYIVEYDEYLGVGSGAFSYVDGVFYSTTFSINRYIESISKGRVGIASERRFDLRERMRYDFLLKPFGLVLDGNVMTQKYGTAWRRALWKELLFFRMLGALKREGEVYRLGRRGMYYWVVMMREFLSGVNNFRREMRAHIRLESNELSALSSRDSLSTDGDYSNERQIRRREGMRTLG
jgi:coproporphyrinogen III oxidase-like Fe-S oxidoreductase